MRSIAPLVVSAVGLVVAFSILGGVPDRRDVDRMGTAVVGDPTVLQAKYDAWKAGMTGRERRLVIGLAWSKALSAGYSTAKGEARLDLSDGSVEVVVTGLPAGEAMDVWLVENRPGKGRSVRAEPGDPIQRVGTLVREGSRASLKTFLAGRGDPPFAVDLIVVAPSKGDPRKDGILFGSPTLFQRLYVAELSRGSNGGGGSAGSPLSLGVVLPVSVSVASLALGQIPALVSEGERLFFNETFNGNGRTCGTCHPAANNLTIDPAFIATLPSNDPLFVAENNPALNNTLNGGRRFENPVLMRRFGLILENLDGFGDLASRFVMRGVPHTFAQGISITPVPGDGTIVPPNHRTGWSGDGSPSNGTTTFGRLRDFAVGAVTQHFPRTTNRVPDVDFRLPTTAELDALEAFLLSTGRQQDLQLANGAPNQLILRDADAEAGKVLFRDGVPNPPANATRCGGCHTNAGSNNTAGQNRNFLTGVELFLLSHADGTGEPRPVDGGFGTAPDGSMANPPVATAPPSPFARGIGNNTFNTASVVEVADTLPAFHNNIATTLEDAIRFYQSPEFAQARTLSGSATTTVPFNATQVGQVAQFLRVINAVDNLDNSAVRFARRAIAALSQSPPRQDLADIALRLASGDCQDSIDVLRAGGLHANARGKLNNAQDQFQAASSGPASVRIDRINRGLEFIAEARALMVSQG